jgi:probable phosphoglycerate mutase
VTELLLARHGETDWNRDLRVQGHADVPLNELGREQARDLAERLEDVALDAIYSSDLVRARETAEAVARAKGLPVRVDPQLRETDFGSWEGLTREEIAERFPDRARPDGETYEQVRERMLAAINRIAAEHAGGTVLIVSHGGALNSVWHHAAGARLERWPNCEVYRIALRDGSLVAVD